jgi:transposase
MFPASLKPDQSRLVKQLCERYGRRLQLVYIPKYSPEYMPMELLWNDWRDNVTHNHDRTQLSELTADSDCYLRRRKRNPEGVLLTLGSPFAAHQKIKT